MIGTAIFVSMDIPDIFLAVRTFPERRFECSSRGQIALTSTPSTAAVLQVPELHGAPAYVGSVLCRIHRGLAVSGPPPPAR